MAVFSAIIAAKSTSGRWGSEYLPSPGKYPDASHALPSVLRSKGLKFVSERGEFGSQFSQRSFFSGKPNSLPSYLPAPAKATVETGARAAGAKAAAEPR